MEYQCGEAFETPTVMDQKLSGIAREIQGAMRDSRAISSESNV